MLHKQCVNLLILLSKFTHINVLLWMQNLLKILCKIYTYFFAVHAKNIVMCDEKYPKIITLGGYLFVY